MYPFVVSEDVGKVDVCFRIREADRIPAQGAHISLHLPSPSTGLVSWEYEVIPAGIAV